MTKRSTAIIILLILVAVLFQWIRWQYMLSVDTQLWSQEAGSLVHADPASYDALDAYPHPGGTVLEAEVALHAIAEIPYEFNGPITDAFLDAIVIASIVAVCILLRKEPLWAASVYATLTISWLYQYASPPSAIASLLVVLLAFLTIFIDERKSASAWPLVCWSIVSGAAVASRLDIGIFSSAVFMLFLCVRRRLSVPHVLAMTAGAFTIFFALDPFMWFAPVQQIQATIAQGSHVSDLSESHVSLWSLSAISFLSVICIALASWSMITLRKAVQPISQAFILTLMAMTVIVYAVCLHASTQATRYFMPVIFIWETLLPLYGFSIIDRRWSDAATRERWKIALVSVLIAYNVVWAVVLYCAGF